VIPPVSSSFNWDAKSPYFPLEKQGAALQPKVRALCDDFE